MVNISQLLTSNDCPSAAARAQVRGYITNLDEMTPVLDKRIVALTAELAKFTGGREALQRERERYASVLSPLRELPLDVCGEIFGWACEDDPFIAFRLSQVSRHWRFAALGNSAIWTTMRLGHQKDESSAYQYLLVSINRAHNRAMTLVFNEVEDRPGCRLALRRVLPSVRWKSITWTVYREGRIPGKKITDTIMTTSSATLQHLAIESPKTLKLDAPWLLQQASRLKSFSLQNASRIAVETLHLPWAQLTSLSLSSSDSLMDVVAPHFVQILLQCSANLEECTLRFHSYRHITVSEDDFEPILFPRLRKLHLYTESPEWITDIIETPMVEDVVLHLRPQERPMDLEAPHRTLSDNRALDWLAECGPQLKKLDLEGLEFEDWEELFPNLREVEMLTIKGTSECEAFTLGILTINPNVNGPAGVLLPNLVALKLVCIPSSDAQKALIAFVRSRWWKDADPGPHTCARLRAVEMVNVNEEEKFVCADGIKDLRRQGLKINVLTTDDIN